MATLKATRGAQRVKTARFTWNFNDTMVNTAGASADFGLTNVSATSWDVINLPPNSVVVGGDLVVETAFDTASYTMTVGDSGSAGRYLASADKKAAARTALTPTGFVNTDGLNIRVGITNADVCTAGKAHLTVEYITVGTVDEVIPA
jgi:hypothetical protein